MEYNEHKKEFPSKIQEIDVIGVIQKVLQAKKTLAIFVVIFALWGVVVALNMHLKNTLLKWFLHLK